MADACCLTSTNGDRPGQHQRVPGGTYCHLVLRAQLCRRSPRRARGVQECDISPGMVPPAGGPNALSYQDIRLLGKGEEEEANSWAVAPRDTLRQAVRAPVAMTSETQPAAAPVPSSRSCDGLAGGSTPFHLHRVLQMAAVDNKLKDLGFFALKRWCWGKGKESGNPWKEACPCPRPPAQRTFL